MKVSVSGGGVVKVNLTVDFTPEELAVYERRMGKGEATRKNLRAFVLVSVEEQLNEWQEQDEGYE